METLDEVNWDHVRVFLATMRSKSLRAAAGQLRLSHPTARRRLAAFEEQLGLRLFDRRRDGLHPTDEARDLLDAAEDVERAMQGLGRAADAAEPGLRGKVRVTLPDILATDLLMPDFVEFVRRWPEIELELDTSYRIVDLDRREADVAIRATPRGKLPPEHLTGRFAGTVYRAVYGTGDNWIGWAGPEADAEWIRDSAFPDLPVRGAINNPHAQRIACAKGMGLTQLPCMFAEPMLERRTEPEPAFDLWVLVHPDLRRSKRLRLFRDEVVAAIKREEPRLTGAGT